MARRLFILTVAGLFVWIALPYALPVAMGGVVAAVLYPRQQQLENVRWPRWLAALVLTLGMTLMVLLPASVTFYIAAKSGLSQIRGASTQAGGAAISDWVSDFLASPRVTGLLDWLEQWFSIQRADILGSAGDLLRGLGAKVADGLGAFVSQLPGLAIGFTIATLSVYFFLVDGPRLGVFVRKNSFFKSQDTDALMKTLVGTCRSVVLASVASGLAQAVVAFLVFWIARVPSAPLFGVLVFLGSFIPVVGAAPVTFGVAIFRLVVGASPGVGIALIIAALAIGIVDNIVRPAFLRGAANLHPMIALVAALGALQVMGFLGIFLGPIIAAVFIATLKVAARARG